MVTAHSNERFRGVFAVTVTPFTPDGRAVDLEGVGRLASEIVADGIDLIVPCGNTGEYYALSDAERRQVVEATMAAIGGRATVVVGVGGPVADAVAQARHAEQAGAAAVMVHHPVHPFLTADGLLAYHRAIAHGTALPLIPYVKSAVLGEQGILQLVDMPEVVAVKYAVNDLQAFGQAVANARGRAQVNWICGTAESWAPFFWAAGAVGFTSGLANVAARQSLAMLEALEAGDYPRAMAVWRKVRPFELLRAQAGDGFNVAVIKAALRQQGRPAGPVRPPSSEVTTVDAERISALLHDWAAVPLGSGAPR